MSPLPELAHLERLVEGASACVRVTELGLVRSRGHDFPLLALTLGDAPADAPAVGFFAGVHGLERVGSHVVLAYLESLLERLRWDPVLREQLGRVRLVFMPVVNPGGMWAGTRCNPSGVDLMRNAPVDAVGRTPWLAGGQRMSPRLPWYRGAVGAPMEVESQVLCKMVERELLGSRFSVALDCHSGFGMRDRIWFPLASSLRPIDHLPEVHALWRLFESAHPHHDYTLEPQSHQYSAHGDLWDHLYLQAQRTPGRVFLPLTLELGSWRWVRKRPSQVFSALGLFNPLAPHRARRVLRRHHAWLDFLPRAASAWKHWLPADEETRSRHHEEALARWYRKLTA